MNIISFSMWGKDDLYTRGAIENAKIASLIYSGWVCRFYCNEEIPSDCIKALRDLGSQVVIVDKSRGKWEGLFWRFYPASESNVDVFISRDTDSRLNSREKAAVDEWLNSGLMFHTMRDHRDHNVDVLGGMWGCKWPFLKNMKQMIDGWSDFDNKGTDQVFLSQKIWPKVKGQEIVHDRYPNGAFFYPDGVITELSEVKDYNPYDNCGEENNTDFPNGRVVRADGRVFKRLDVYRYDPQEMFGKHNIKPFPSHKPIEYGSHVGEIIRL